MKTNTKKNIVVLFIIMFFIILFSSQYINQLEIVPGSYGVMLDTTQSGWNYMTFAENNIYAIKFSIPDNEKNILSDAEIRINGGVATRIHEAGFSRILSNDPSKWESYGTFESATGSWCKVISDAKLQSNGGPIRCTAGETWYIIIKMNSHTSWYFEATGRSGVPADKEIYHYNNGAWESVSFDCFIKVYGYADETFFVGFDYDPLYPKINEPIVFTDKSNQNLIESRTWMIDNVVVGSDPQITHSFSEVGTYQVTLVCVSYEGTNLQITKTIEVKQIDPPIDPDDQNLLLWALLIIVVIILAYVIIIKRKGN